MASSNTDVCTEKDEPEVEKVEKESEKKVEKEEQEVEKVEEKAETVEKEAEEVEKKEEKVEEKTETVEKETEEVEKNGETVEKVEEKAETVEKEAEKVEEKAETVEKEVEEVEKKEDKVEEKVEEKAETVETEANEVEKKEEKAETVEKEAEEVEKKDDTVEEKAATVEKETEEVEKVDEKAETVEKEAEKVEEKAETVEKEAEEVEKKEDKVEEKVEEKAEAVETEANKVEEKVEEKAETVEKEAGEVEKETEKVETVEKEAEEVEKKDDKVEEKAETVEKETEEVEKVEEKAETLETEANEVEKKEEKVEEKAETVENEAGEVEKEAEKVEKEAEEVEKKEEKVEEKAETVEKEAEKVETETEAISFGELPSGLAVTTPMGAGIVKTPCRDSDNMVEVQLPWAKAYVSSDSITSKGEEVAIAFGELPSGLTVTTPMGAGIVTAPCRSSDNIVEVQLPWAKVYVSSDSVTSRGDEGEAVNVEPTKQTSKRARDDDEEEKQTKKIKTENSRINQSLDFLAGIKKNPLSKDTNVTTPFGNGSILSEEREGDGIITVKLKWATAFLRPEVIGEEANPIEKKILTQVEFYFSNSNLPVDRYLKNICDCNNGWVSIATVASFQRMVALNTDLPTVVAALRKSKELLEVDSSGKLVKRRLPLPTNLDLNKSTIYSKGFAPDSTIESVTDFFEKHMQPGHTICCVRLRRFRSNGGGPGFKGSVFVEFSSGMEAERISALDLQTLDGSPLLIMMKNAYIEAKNKEYASKKEKRGGRGQRRQRGEEGQGQNKRQRRQQNDEQEVTEQSIDKDLIIKITGLGDTSASREWLQETIQSAGTNVAYVDYSRGTALAHVRLNERSEVKASAAIKKLENVDLDGKKPQFTALEGDDEVQYWKNLEQQRRKRKSQPRNSSRGGRGRSRGRGGRRRGSHHSKRHRN